MPGKAYHFSAEIEGDFPEYSYPADKLLTIKEGAQIMFLKNDPSSEKRYYNGMIGEVVAVNETGIVAVSYTHLQDIISEGIRLFRSIFTSLVCLASICSTLAADMLHRDCYCCIWQ